MTFLRISAAQADSIRGAYGDYHALEPVPLPDTDDYILTDAVIAHPAFAAVLATLQALPVYPAWSGDGVSYTDTDITERDGKLWRCRLPHTSQPTWQPGVAHSLWRIAHRDGIVPEWTQPTGEHDSYPLDFVVSHGAQQWRSNVDANVWEPGTGNTWTLLDSDGNPVEPEQPAAWVQPTGAHDAYNTGDRVTFEGQVYESTIDANVWSPTTYGWVLVQS